MTSPVALSALLQFEVSAGRLRADAILIAITAVALTAAVAAFAVFLMRRNKSDRALLWFAVFAALYGVRILIGVPVFRAGFGVPTRTADALTAAITFCIQIPGVFFAVALIDAWKDRLARVLIGLAFAEAGAGLVTVVADGGIRQMYFVNNLLVLLIFVPAYVWLFYKNSAGYRVTLLKISFLVFISVVLFDNLAGIGAAPFRVRLEPFGFVLLLAGMGWAAAQKTITDQQRLVAIERELEIARTIQKSILPETVPQLPGLDIAVRYEPMTAVAGDFYDFVRIDEHRLGVLVADVSGHGVPAALIASMLKMAFSTHAAEARDPAQLLANLNAAMCGKFSAHFVTAVYAVIDIENRTVTYSGAAHPPILLGRNGSAEELAENGLMLGAFPFAQYANANVTIAPGDRLLLYTDGLVEAANTHQEEFGSERLKAALNGSAAAQLIGTVFEQVAIWSGMNSGRAQEDDLTAIAIAVDG